MRHDGELYAQDFIDLSYGQDTVPSRVESIKKALAPAWNKGGSMGGVK
jgi:hypothetical protein